MNIRLVDNEAEFDALEEEWNRLADRTSASIFSSFDYARLAWKHFHKLTDRLFILVFSDESSVVGIAPFCIIRSRKRGIPCRVVRFIAAWEGDRPRILAEAGSEPEIWGRLFRFLENDFTGWEILDLIEQSVDGLPGCGWTFLPRSGWYWESQTRYGRLLHFTSRDLGRLSRCLGVEQLEETGAGRLAVFPRSSAGTQ